MTAENSRTLSTIESAVEFATGMFVDEIRRTPLDILQKKAEAYHGRPLQVTGIEVETINTGYGIVRIPTCNPPYKNSNNI